MAGCGKTHVIKALSMYFKDKLQNLSFQGVAASLIHGTTIHNFLGINKNGKSTSEKIDNLRRKIKNIEVLIIDEKSFNGKQFLIKMNRILKQATGSNKVFGGMPVIFFGDIFQLAPVKDSVI